jgi:hypothetical protein
MDETLTADDGSFFLRIAEDGEHFVRAEADGFAPAELGPLDLRRGQARGDLELGLGRGGRIEGRVLAPPGRSDEGVVVVANRGDGRPHTTRSGEGGCFAFDGLAAGAWAVERGRLEITPAALGSWSIGRGGARTELRRDCEVREGETTSVVVDLRDDIGARVQGQLRLDGAPAAGWFCEAWPGNASTFTGDLPRAMLDGQGQFEVGLDEPGPVRLAFQPSRDGVAGGSISVVTTLAPGDNPWSIDLATTRVEGEVTRAASDPVHLVLEVDGDTASARVPIRLDRDGRFALAAVLVGRAKVLGYARGGTREPQVLAELTLGRGLPAVVNIR